MAHDDNHDDNLPEHVRGPELDEDGFLVGEIALPGGLPPEDDEDDDEEAGGRGLDVPCWDEAFSIADRDGFVLFDPKAPGGFRTLTSDERHEILDAVRAGTPGAQFDVQSSQGGTAEARSIENAHPATATADAPRDDIDRLHHRTDDIRARLATASYRKDVEQDQDVAERRQQLERWHDDDTQDRGESVTEAAEDSDTDDGGILPHCLIYTDDPEWYE